MPQPTQPFVLLRCPDAASLSEMQPLDLYGQSMITVDVLDGQTSIDEALADIGEVWSAEGSVDEFVQLTLF